MKPAEAPIEANMSDLFTRMSVLQEFEDLEDPRQPERCQYPLQEMLLVALCAVSSDADDWVHVAEWGRLKLEWLRKWLPFEHGVASHDTFSRLFGLLEPKHFEACFVRWMSRLCGTLAGHVAVDGKSMRGSHEAGAGMAHVVSAWHVPRGVTLGQLRTAAKSNEITAIPELLEAFDIEGATITLDAMGCQREIVQQIVEAQADYVIAVKNNQPGLAQAVEALFSPAAMASAVPPVAAQHRAVDKGNGRLHTRCCVVQSAAALSPELRALWPGLRSAVMIESTREIVQGRDRSAPSTEWRYYISSRELPAAEFSQIIQQHWHIENRCHWVLDVVFDEDACRVRRDHGPENLALLRRISLNLIRTDTSKGSIKLKRHRAAWNDDFLAQLLGLRPVESVQSPAQEPGGG